MKQKILLLTVACFVSLILIPLSVKQSSGCADGGSANEMFFSFFTPDIIRDYNGKVYAPFFLDASYPNTKASGFTDQNINEWKNYLNTKCEDDIILYLIYQSSENEIEGLLSHLKNNSSEPLGALMSQFVNSNPDKSKLAPSLQYLSFAKKCEPIVNPQFNEWDEKKIDTTDLTGLINEGLLTASKTNDKFLKLRYNFQVLRLYYFGGKYQKAIDYYKINIESAEDNSSITIRALGYEAGAFHELKNYAQANYIYSLLYDRYPESKASAYWSFHPQEDNDWQQCLALAKTPREKMVLWHLLGIYKDPLRAMKEIYAIDSKSTLIDLLLVRAINIEEQYVINENKVVPEGYGYYHYAKLDFDPDTSAVQLYQFVKTCAGNANTLHPALWNIAAGYLAYLSNDNATEVEKYFNAARSYGNLDPRPENQIKLIEILLYVRDIRQISPSVEQTLFSKLIDLKTIKLGRSFDTIWFYNLSYDSTNQSNNAKNFIYDELSKRYLAQGDTIKSEMCIHQKGRDYYNPDDNIHFFEKPYRTQKMLDFMRTHSKTDWNNFLLAQYFAKETDVTEWQAIHLFNNYDFEGAVKKFKETPAAGDDTLYADPFLIHIYDNHDSDFHLPNKIIYTKLAFAKKMVELQHLAETDKKNAADYYFQLANGYYNMTWFGNARHLYENIITDDLGFSTGSGFFTFNKPLAPWVAVLDSFNSCSQARKYYSLALENSTSKELSAQLCWMIAKCENNTTLTGDSFKAGEHMKMMKDKYSDTQFYKEVIAECGYFRTFLAKN